MEQRVGGGHVVVHQDIVKLMIKNGIYLWNHGLYCACRGPLPLNGRDYEVKVQDLKPRLLDHEGGRIEIVNLMIYSQLNN